MFSSQWNEAVGLGHVGLEGNRVTARHPDAIALIEYWTSKQDAAGTVRWNAVQPVEIKKALPFIFLAEPQGGDWRYRLFGTGVSARFGIDFTGKLVSRIYDPVTADSATRLYRKVADRNEARVFNGRYLGLALEHVVVEIPHMLVLGRDGLAWVFGGVFFCDNDAPLADRPDAAPAASRKMEPLTAR
jgi:hypothetical protein